MNTTPRSQIKVFISSAQNEENGFDWATLRRKIKSKLSECSYINPFIIEDGASEIPSSRIIYIFRKFCNCGIIFVWFCATHFPK